MPELAAHLERVARELAAAINNLDDMWLSDTFPTESVAKLLAAALAACAREARIEEHARTCDEYDYDFDKRRNVSCGMGWSCVRRRELEAQNVTARQD